MDINNNTMAISQFKINNFDMRIIWYNKITHTYTVTDKYGTLTNDNVPKEFESLAKLRDSYIEQYVAIEFLSIKPNVPTMVAGME